MSSTASVALALGLAAVVAAVLAVSAWRQRRALERARGDVARHWERGLARFTQTGDLLPDVLLEIDAGQVVTYANPALYRLTGYAPPDLRVGMSLADLMAPAERPRLARALESARRGWPVHGESFLLRGAGGRLVPVALHLSLTTDQGQFAGWRGVLQDLEARRRAQAAPRAERPGADAVIAEVLKDVIHASAANQDAALARALARTGSFLGVDRCYLFREEAPGGRLAARHLWYADGVTPLVEDQDAPAFAAYPWVRSLFAAGRSLRVPDVSRLPREAAGERAVWQRQGVHALMAVPLRDGERIFGVVGCEILGEARQWDDRDLALLESVAEICQHLALRVTAVVDLLPEPAFAVDPAGDVVGWNAALEDLTGLPASGRIGAPLAVATLDLLGDARALPVEALLASPDADAAPLEVVAPHWRHGRPAHLRFTARTLRDGGGQFVGVVQMVQDVTQAALVDRRLRQRVREATRDVALLREEVRRLQEGTSPPLAADREAAGRQPN